MAVVKLKPTSPGQRHCVRVTHDMVTASAPKRSLTSGKKRISARNHAGRITVRHRGSASHKRRYRQIDFKRCRDGIAATVRSIEYDPNRSAYIALLCYADGLWSYIIAPDGLKVGDELMSGADAPIRSGNTMSLKDLPIGSVIHNIEMRPGKGAQLMRAAGAYASLLGREGKYAIIRCRSGEMRRIHVDCRATLGVVSNKQHNLAKLGKAGRKRWLGRRPHVRGVAMNPIDHPMGGGEGRTSGGRHPCTPWGQPTKGYRTRNNKRTQKFIIRRRAK